MPHPLQEAVLPNKMTISCLRKREVPVVYRQVQEYFKNGIELGEGDVVFDVGANIGLFALSTYERCHHNVTVYAFEPIPALFEALKHNAHRYDAERLRVFPYGLSRECGTITFAYYPNATVLSTAYAAGLKEEMIKAVLERLDQVRWLRRLVPPRLGSLILGRLSKRFFQVEPVACKVVTLSAVMREHDIRRIDLLKVDVEKSELDVLAGIEDQDWPKIKQVIVEVHDVDHRVEQVSALLKEREFSHITVEPSLPIFRVFNLYALRRTPPSDPLPD